MCKYYIQFFFVKIYITFSCIFCCVFFAFCRFMNEKMKWETYFVTGFCVVGSIFIASKIITSKNRYELIVSFWLVICNNNYIYLRKTYEKKSNMLVILFSGKRCVGKDFICDNAIKQLKTMKCVKVSHSAIIKRMYCDKTNTDLNKMLNDRSFKELHRNKMIELARNEQKKNKYILCDYVYNKIMKMNESDSIDIVFISDFRRKFELNYYQNRFTNVISIRINVDNNIRQKRGWIYDKIKDERYTECELDTKTDWDLIFINNGSINDIYSWINNTLKPKIESVYL